MHTITAFLLFSVVMSAEMQAQTKKIGATDLQRMIGQGDKVKVATRNGVHAAAVVEQIDNSNILLNVELTSNGAEVPRGIASLPLTSLAEVKVCRMTGRKRKILPIVLGSTLGTFSFIAAGATEEKSDRYFPMALGFTGGVITGGYFLGRALDRECITFQIEK